MDKKPDTQYPTCFFCNRIATMVLFWEGQARKRETCEWCYRAADFGESVGAYDELEAWPIEDYWEGLHK